MLGFRRRMAVECARDMRRSAVYEWKSWDGWYGKTLRIQPASPKGDCEARLSDKSDLNHGRRDAFDCEAAPRPLKQPAHHSGCDELPAALLETASRIVQGFGLEFGALDNVSEDRPAFLREPWERHP